MKKLVYLLIAASLILALVPVTASAHIEEEPFSTDLIAGQRTDVGDVNVWNDGDYLYVQFVSEVCMVETHLHVATLLEDIPQKNGNPPPGKFDYSAYHGCSRDYTYTIPLGEWGYGTPLYIAAHAALGEEQTMTIHSDGLFNTQVTGGNVPGASYPYPAVDTWEAFNDPPDTTASFWDQRLTYGGSAFSFSMGDWVWESYRVVDWTTTQNVTFEHPFTVPGYPTGGMLYIATDNTYSVSLDGVFVGEHTDWRNWQIVGGYDIYPVEGANVLEIIGSNYGDSSYTQYNNPAGLIYEAEITYLTPSETAWGAGFDFPGKNWSTYFTYTVQESVKIDLIPCPINYPHGRDGTGYVIFSKSVGPNNLDMTVHLEGAPASPTTYDVYLFLDGRWYGGGPVGQMTVDGEGNGQFDIAVSVAPGGHWLAVDLTAPGSLADIYETPGIHTSGARSVYMEF